MPKTAIVLSTNSIRTANELGSERAPPVSVPNDDDDGAIEVSKVDGEEDPATEEEAPATKDGDDDVNVGGWSPSGSSWKDFLFFCGPGWLVSVRVCVTSSSVVAVSSLSLSIYLSIDV